MYKWDLTSPTPSKVLELESYPTDIDFPISKALSDCFAIGFGDGSFRLVNKVGKVEKSVVEAHKGAVISVRWSSDGYSLMTAGEDGFIKIWSKTGTLSVTRQFEVVLRAARIAHLLHLLEPRQRTDPLLLRQTHPHKATPGRTEANSVEGPRRRCLVL
jgi:WD40 repeat protein